MLPIMLASYYTVMCQNKMMMMMMTNRCSAACGDVFLVAVRLWPYSALFRQRTEKAIGASLSDAAAAAAAAARCRD